jgi:hypothetical protein
VQEEVSFNYTIVYLPYEKVYGELISLGIYASLINYIKDGIQYQTMVLNDEFDIIEEVHIDIEEEYQ